MKKYITLIVLLFSFYSVFGQGFDVDNYNVDIYINKAGYFDVVEKYDINFTEDKHGIYREIIRNYELAAKDKRIENRKIEISNIQVSGAPFSVNSRLQDNLIIKIGSADETVFGPKSYKISYRVNYAFLFDDSTSYFYWNIRPSEWLAEFKQINFRIHLPTKLALDSSKYFVYSGAVGSSALTDDFDISYKNEVLSGKMKPGKSMIHSENLTALIYLPKNYVLDASTTWSYWWSHWVWILFIPILFIVFYFIWKKYGKEDYTPSIVEYLPPKGIDPAMAGYLMRDHENDNHLISLIPYWGNLGFIKLIEVPYEDEKKKPDINIKKLKNLPSHASSYEKLFFDGMFSGSKNDSVLISSLENKFYITLKDSLSNLHDAAQVYYLEDSTRVRNSVRIMLILTLIFGSFGFFYFWGLFAGLSMIITSIVLLILNKYMLKKNTTGSKLEAELFGYKKFIKAVDEDKLKTLLEQDPFYFEKTMSYALSFGMLDKWSKKFEALNVRPPEWYNGSNHTLGAFTTVMFMSQFSNSMSSIQSSMISTPAPSSSSGGFGGGGFSGGGFGGGGGGSW